jgi:hypothetical protein
MQIKPLMAPTKQIMKIGVRNYEWHELFPKGGCYFFLFYVLKELNLKIIDVNMSDKKLFSCCSQK